MPELHQRNRQAALDLARLRGLEPILARSGFGLLGRPIKAVPDVGGLTEYVSGRGVSESCEGSCNDMRMAPHTARNLVPDCRDSSVLIF